MTSSEEKNYILCCLCSEPIEANPSNMCLECIQKHNDITKEISKDETISFCGECERYLQPPQFWLKCDLESRELLQICLSHIKGLSKVTLIDASFIWTEPHSRRIKVKLVVQKELFHGVKLQQGCVVTFVVSNLQCPQCKKQYSNMEWSTQVQLRQRVKHKRTFLYIEQLILKCGMHENCTNIKEMDDGLDFYFNSIPEAKKMVDFINGFCITQVKKSKRLISHDNHSNIFNYKRTWSVIIAPICKGDLVFLPKKLKNSLGGLGPVCLVHKIGNAIHLIDPTTLQNGLISAKKYWETPFKSFANSKNLKKYYVLDCERVREKPKYSCKYYKLADVEICKENEISGDNIIYARTHLGHLLNSGDYVFGYDLLNSNFSEKELEKVKDLPDIILVKKHYHKRKRKYKIKRMEKIQREKEENQKEEEEFIEDVMDDEDVKKNIDLIEIKENEGEKEGEGEEEGENESEK